MGYLEHEVALGHLPEETDVAIACGVGKGDDLVSFAGRICHREFQRMPPGTRVDPSSGSVAFSTEQYAEIAHRIGYEYPTQFTRDFRETFGFAPHDFRYLVSTHSNH